MCIKIKKPSECNKEEINNFHRFVKRGEEVEKWGLRKRIKRAEVLAFHYENDTLVGVAALKRPFGNYTKNVFKKAGISEEYHKYKLEIGWAFTKREYRRKGICSNLIKRLISILQTQNIFATTRTENFPMQEILVRNGFQKVGNSYLGRTGDYNIQLFVRSDRDNCKKNE